MTLITNVATPEKAIQSSDRRLTYPDGRIDTDESNKAVAVFCDDAHFVIAYTGIALIGRFSKRTDEWLVDHLSGISAYKMDLLSLVNAIKKEIALEIKDTKATNKALTFALCGYRRGIPFIGTISNVENDQGQRLSVIDEDFHWSSMALSPEADPDKACIIVQHGEKRAFTPSLRRRIIHLGRKRFFNNSEGRTVADELVNLTRAAGKTPKYGHVIGRSCMTAIVNPDPAEPIICKYHARDGSTTQYMPHLIAHNMSFKDIEFEGTWPGEVHIGNLGSPHSPQVSQAKRKKVGRNEPCPCGSEKKYKKCHGAVSS